jgi:hypothetical protein
MGFLSIIKNNNIDELEIYLRTHDANEETQGQSLLYWAVFHRRLNFVKKLIEQGADINHKDKLGRTPLSTAFFYNFTDIAKLLLDNHSKVESTTIDRALFGWNNHVQIESINLLQEYQWVNLYLDDLRDIPEGFIGARTMEHAIDILKNYKVHILSLDHDLGTDRKGNLRKTGYDFVKYICSSGRRIANRIHLHTDNVVGRDNMYQTLLASQRRGFVDQEVEIYSYPFIKNRFSD